MKKALALILILALCLICSTPSFAYIDVGEDTDIDVYEPSDDLPDGEIDMGELEMETYEVANLSGYYKTEGRTHYKDGMPSLAYTASSFEFNAYCEGDIYMTFSIPKINSSVGNGTYLTVYIDGVKQSRSVGHLNYYGEETAVIATNLSLGKHNIKIVRSTELEPSLVYVKDITLCGKFLEKPKDNDLLVEFVGGALATGQRILYDKELALYDSTCAIYQDGTATYAYKTAEKLNADISVVARQGIGVITGWQKVSMIDAYNYTMHAADNTLLYDFNKQPDIVVVELGGCDYDVLKWNSTTKTEEEIVQGFYDMLALLREKNPNAYIVWIYGFNDIDLKNVIPTVIESSGGEEKGFYGLQLTYNNSGTNGLPSISGHETASEELVNFITTKKLHLPKAPSVTFTPDNNGIYIESPVITLTEKDKATQKMYYKLYKTGETVPASFTEYTAPLTVNTNGEYTLIVASSNSSGEMGLQNTYTFTYNSEYKDYIVGDVNNDTEINSKDLTTLRRYLAGWELVVNEKACDTNGDGTVNSKDATHFARYLAGWEGIELAQ